MFKAPGRGHGHKTTSSCRRRANEHTGKVGGRGHARSPPSAKPMKKKDVPSIVSRYSVPKLEASILTSDDILFYGLCFVGFGEERQKVVKDKSVYRFKAHFGPEPRTVKDLMSDLCEKFSDTSFKELLMALNWLKLYDIESVLAARWNYDESVCRQKVKKISLRIQSFSATMIVFDPQDFIGRKKFIL